MDSIHLKIFFLHGILFDNLYSLVGVHEIIPIKNAQEHNAVPT